ncbi:MAG: hypothetical protein QW835_07335, partial [Candidatus Hadarchaeum sp.]
QFGNISTFQKIFKNKDAERIVRQGSKPAEVVKPEPTGNGDPCKNPGEKPGKDAGKFRGRTGRDSDCRKKIPTRKDGE